MSDEFPDDEDTLRWIAQPVPGSIIFSDGAAVNIDANLMIGRNPMRDQLEEGMRGIVHGVDYLAVSRQQFELRREGWDVVVISRGDRTLLDRAGRLSNLARGASRAAIGRRAAVRQWRLVPLRRRTRNAASSSRRPLDEHHRRAADILRGWLEHQADAQYA